VALDVTSREGFLNTMVWKVYIPHWDSHHSMRPCVHSNSPCDERGYHARPPFNALNAICSPASVHAIPGSTLPSMLRPKPRHSTTDNQTPRVAP
jgi:hypothetical protein